MRRLWRLLAIFLLLVLVASFACVAFAYARAGAVVARARQRSSILSIADLSPEQRRILLVVEDPAFEHHHGVDLRTPGAGLTTITQGLVKFLYFSNFEPGLAKIPQTLYAIGFDLATPKDTQLELYLNHTYLGTINRNPVRGYEQGAQTFMGRSFRELTRDQFIQLVATTIAPDRLNPARNPAGNAERTRRIQRLVAGQCAPRNLRDVTYEDCRAPLPGE